MNNFKALRLDALNSIINPDDDANLRHIFRWYSKEFSTPLHLVSELDEYDVLQAFYESQYEELKEEEREKELEELLETEEQIKSKLRKLDTERAEGFEFARITAQQETQKLSDIKNTKPEEAFKNMTKEAPQTVLPTSKKEDKPEISMRFVNDQEFQRELDSLEIKK